MRKLTALLVMVLAAPMAHGQAVPGIAAISAQQCVWHAGDNPAWAAPNLDEAGWQPYSTWALSPDEPHIWVRCHADLSALRGVEKPAIQVSVPAAYQIYIDGEPIARAGNLHSGDFSMNTIRSFPLPEGLFGAQPATLAARITYRYLGPGLFDRNPRMAVLKIRAGNETMLDALRARTVLAQANEEFPYFICFGILGVLGFVLFGLFLYDRSRGEFLLLSVACVGLAAIYGAEYSFGVLANYSFSAGLALYSIGDIAGEMGRTWFFFALARRRMPRLFWILIGLTSLIDVAGVCAPLLTPARSLWILRTTASWAVPLYFWGNLASDTAPFVAFWPWARIARRARPLAALSMVWGATMVLYFSSDKAFGRLIGLPGLSKWYPAAKDLQVLVTFGVIVALMGLLFRDQQRTARERAQLAGEIHAASEIQRMLVPANLDIAPGLKAEAVFLPARDVGGDFYRCRVLPGGTQRVLLGDVSGKGTAAAMTASMLLGAAEGHDADSASALLAHLNRALLMSKVGGFATCLCTDIGRHGQVILANAGHLPPYRNGVEVEMPGSLPLGLAPETTYAESILHLAPNEQLTFLSDGVVEAQSAAGEIFGFDRTAAISTKSAEEIARAAQAFGQQDDITVLTLAFTGQEVALA